MLTHMPTPARTPAHTHDHGQAGAAPAARPWIGVRFTCAGAYTRVYRDPHAREYLARCPRCGLAARFPVGPGGTACRFFDVSCR